MRGTSMRIAAGSIAVAALLGAPALQAENPVTLKTYFENDVALADFGRAIAATEGFKPQ